jgi:hypothetical protein
MYGIVVMVALSTSAQAAECYSRGCAPANYGGGWGHYAIRRACCGMVTPSQLGWGTGAPQVSAAEQKKWDEYVASLDRPEHQSAVSYLWDHADLGARRKLLTKIPPPIVEDGDTKEIEKPEPLSDDEMQKWKEYVGSLKGEAKKKAETEWAKADLAGKRKLLDKIPDKE